MMRRQTIDFILSLPRRTVTAAIRLYQKTLSPDHGWSRCLFPYGCCKFRPTCSEYTRQAVDELGIIRGLWLGTWRILRCNPWSKGGYEPVPGKKDTNK